MAADLCWRRVAGLALLTALCAGCQAPAAPVPPTSLVRPLGTWQGRGSQTIGIVSESGRLRVTWRTHGDRPAGSGTFRLALHSAVSGRPIEVITDERGEGSGATDIADDPRPYNLMVESSGLDWWFSVEEIVAAAPR